MHKSRTLAAAAIAALASLAACHQPEVITVNQYDPQAEALKNAPPVAPPPMIQATKTYRCADNSLYFVDFYTDNTATIRTSREGSPTRLESSNGEPPFTGGGNSVSATGDRVTINGKSCHT
jgi:uncharacterized lipoprotein